MRAKLTDKLLKGLESPATGQVDVWDKIMPSFGIRVSMGGRKSFMVGTRINGKYRRLTIKPPYQDRPGGPVSLTLADARKQAQQILAHAQAGIEPKQRRRRAEARALYRAYRIEGTSDDGKCTVIRVSPTRRNLPALDYTRFLCLPLCTWPKAVEVVCGYIDQALGDPTSHATTDVERLSAKPRTLGTSP